MHQTRLYNVQIFSGDWYLCKLIDSGLLTITAGDKIHATRHNNQLTYAPDQSVMYQHLLVIGIDSN